MNEEQFNSEKNYKVALSISKSMLSKRLITDKEYNKIDRMLMEKYKPIIGSL